MSTTEKSALFKYGIEVEKMIKKLEGICIAISGTHGSGTSTAARSVAGSLNLRLVSAGEIFREAAEERGLDISEFIRIVEGNTYLKKGLDESMREEARKGDVVIEGRIACWTVAEFANLRVMLDTSFETRITRIAERQGMSKQKVRSETLQREKEEKEWFLHSYGIDLSDLTIYDIIINTERMSSKQVTKIIEAVLN